MFDKMMKYKKAWKFFRAWVNNIYDYDFNNKLNRFFYHIIADCDIKYYIENEIIYFLIMIFFDEYNINVLNSNKYSRMTHASGFSDVPGKRIESLIEICEMAFELLEERL